MTTTHSLDSFYHTHSTRNSTTREHNLKASRSNEDKEIVNGNDYAKKLLVIINWQAGVGVKWGNGNNISNITPTGSRQTCQRESERQCQKYFYFNTQQILYYLWRPQDYIKVNMYFSKKRIPKNTLQKSLIDETWGKWLQASDILTKTWWIIYIYQELSRTNFDFS